MQRASERKNHWAECFTQRWKLEVRSYGQRPQLKVPGVGTLNALSVWPGLGNIELTVELHVPVQDIILYISALFEHYTLTVRPGRP
jgi:hypothetical protein